MEICRMEIARTLDELEKMREAWNSFQEHSAEVEDFELFKLILNSRREILRPHVMLMSSARGPEAIMASRIEESILDLKLGYKTIWRQNARILSVPHGGFMGDVSKTNAERFLREHLTILKNGGADTIYYQGIPLGSPLYEAVRTVVPFCLREHVAKPYQRCSLKLPPNIDNLFKKMNGKNRHELRRKARVLERDFPGQICFRILGEPQEMDRLCRDVEQIAMKTYQRSLGVGYINNEENRKRFKLYADKGQLFALLLYISDKPCAFFVGYVSHKTVYLYFTGFDPAYRKYEPGTLLFLRMIEELIDRKVETIDFGFGDADYKHRYGAESRDEISFYVFRPSLKWVSLNFVRDFFTLSRSLAVLLLDKLGLTQKIKTGWRRRSLSKYQGG